MKHKQKEPKPKKQRMHVRVGGTNLAFTLTILILLGMGIVMMFSASYAIAINEGKDGYYYALRQAIFAGVGLLAMIGMSFFDYHQFQRRGVALLLYLGSIVLLILVYIIGTDLGTGCKRWIRLPFTTFQPSELAKFAIVILFAFLINQNFDRMKKATVGTIPFALLLGAVVALVLPEPHLSCSILICLIGVTLMFVGGARWWHITIVGLIGAAVMGLFLLYLIKVKGVGYFETRIDNWLDPFNSTDEKGSWQTRQSLIAIGSGGLFGLGLGESRQKYIYLPEAENDFVFSIVCEELGLAGAIMIILLFVLLVAQGFSIAAHCKDRFGMLIAIGFTLQIGLQAFINIGVVSGLLPNTGISLPFFSYGGTALIMQLAEMGIVLNISRPREIVEPVRSVRKAEPEQA